MLISLSVSFLLTGAFSLSFFYGKDLPFSNFHPVPFILNGIQYSCNEQYRLDKKAVLFQDIKQDRERDTELLRSTRHEKERKTSPEF